METDVLQPVLGQQPVEVLRHEVRPEAVLLRAVNFQQRVGFQIILADGILERFTEDGVVVNDRVGGVALQQDLLLKLIQHLRRDLAQLQAQRLKILCDAPGDHPIVADKGCRLDGCFMDLHPLVEIVQKQHLRLVDGLEGQRQGLGGFSIYFFVGSAPPCGQLPGLIIHPQLITYNQNVINQIDIRQKRRLDFSSLPKVYINNFCSESSQACPQT